MLYRTGLKLVGMKPHQLLMRLSERAAQSFLTLYWCKVKKPALYWCLQPSCEVPAERGKNVPDAQLSVTFLKSRFMTAVYILTMTEVYLKVDITRKSSKKNGTSEGICYGKF